MNKKAVQIFLTASLISSLGMIGGCTPEDEGGEAIDDGINQEEVNPPEAVEGGEIEEGEEIEEEGGEGGEEG